MIRDKIKFYHIPPDSSCMGRTAGSSSSFLSFFPKYDKFLYLFNAMVNSWFRKHNHCHYFTIMLMVSLLKLLLLLYWQKASYRMSQGVMCPLHQNLRVKSIFNQQISNCNTVIFLYILYNYNNILL